MSDNVIAKPSLLEEKEWVPPTGKRNKRKSEEETKQRNTAVKTNESASDINMEIIESNFLSEAEMEES